LAIKSHRAVCAPTGHLLLYLPKILLPRLQSLE
jgi:hypothetical protein